MILIVLGLLVALVAILTVLVVGLLRSHAVIIRALHDAGIELDAGDGAGHDHDHHAHDHDRHGPDRRDRTEPAAGLRPSVEVVTATAPDIRTVDGVPEPVGISGQRATDLTGVTPGGGARSVSVTRGGATLLAFLTTGCATCATFWRTFGEGVRLPAGTRLVIVTKGDDAESPADVATLAPPDVVTLASSRAWDDYRIPVAPYFVLVDGKRGIVAGEGAAHSWDLVSQLLERALADAGYADGQLKRRDLLRGRQRAQRIDQDLLNAGITPGDPRLHHRPVMDLREVDTPGPPTPPSHSTP